MGENTVKHSFSSQNREGLMIDGVNDVVSFDEKGIALETECGSMAIEGEGLHITVLNITDGRVEIEGKINGLYYFDRNPKQSKGLFARKNV